MSAATPGPREAPASAALAEAETARQDRLRALNRTLRVLWTVVLAPFLLFPVAMGVVGAADGETDPRLVVLIALGAAILPFAFVAAQVMQVWAAQSYRHRHDGVKRRPVDWGNPAWAPVRAAFEASGLDPGTIRAESVWDQSGKLLTRHVPRPTPGRMGRMSDWGVRRSRPLVGLGVAVGIVLAVLDEVGTDPTDGTAFTVILAIALVCVLPIGWRNGRAQYSLNLANPGNVVLIPMHWRPNLRRDPSSRVHLMHEIAHARHDDPGRRRLLDTFSWVGRFAVFVDTAAVVAMRVNEAVLMVLFAVTLAGGIIAVRGATRLIAVVQELRADTEACHDAEAVGHLSAFLHARQAEQPSAAKAARIAALDAALATSWRNPPARLILPATVPAALFVLPVLLAAVAQWTGLVGSSV